MEAPTLLPLLSYEATYKFLLSTSHDVGVRSKFLLSLHVTALLTAVIDFEKPISWETETSLSRNSALTDICLVVSNFKSTNYLLKI